VGTEQTISPPSEKVEGTSSPCPSPNCAHAHVAVEASIVKPALNSKYMAGKAALYFQNHLKTWSKFMLVFSFKCTSGSVDETVHFTIVVSASRRSSQDLRNTFGS